MAGETPGAERHRQQRRPVRRADDRSTDKTYRSGDVSAITRSPSDRSAAPPPAAKPRKVDERSTDKYYADLLQPRAAGKGREVVAVPGGTLVRRVARPKPADAHNELTVTDAGQIKDVLALAVDKARDGRPGIVLVTVAGDAALMRRTRAFLDGMVTRQELDEDEARDIKFTTQAASVAPDLSAPPVPAGDKKTDDNEDLDIAAFLAGTGEEDAEKAAAEPDWGATEAKADDDDDTDAFLAPAPMPEGEFVKKEIPPLPITNDQLDRAVPTDAPVRVVDTEPAATVLDETSTLTAEDVDAVLEAIKPDETTPLTPEIAAVLTETQPLTGGAPLDEGKFKDAVDAAVDGAKGDEDTLRPEYDLTKLKPTNRKPGRRSGRGV